MTDQEMLRAAFQAILRGDYATRDKICAGLKRRMETPQWQRFVKEATEKPIMVNMGTLNRQPDGSFK